MFTRNPMFKTSSDSDEGVPYSDSPSARERDVAYNNLFDITNISSLNGDFLFKGKKEIKNICGLFGTVKKPYRYRNKKIEQSDFKEKFTNYYGVNLDANVDRADNRPLYNRIKERLNTNADTLFYAIESIKKNISPQDKLKISQVINQYSTGYYINESTKNERKILQEESYTYEGQPVVELFEQLFNNIEGKENNDSANNSPSYENLFSTNNKLLENDRGINMDKEDVFGILFVYDKNGGDTQGRGIIFHIYRDMNLRYESSNTKLRKVQGYFQVKNNVLTIDAKAGSKEIIELLNSVTSSKIKTIKKGPILPHNNPLKRETSSGSDSDDEEDGDSDDEEDGDSDDESSTSFSNSGSSRNSATDVNLIDFNGNGNGNRNQGLSRTSSTSSRESDNYVNAYPPRDMYSNTNDVPRYGGKRKTRRRSTKKHRKSKKVGGKKTKPKTKGKKIPFKKLLKKTRAKKH